jgi:hypothetical protein
MGSNTQCSIPLGLPFGFKEGVFPGMVHLKKSEFQAKVTIPCNSFRLKIGIKKRPFKDKP